MTHANATPNQYGPGQFRRGGDPAQAYLRTKVMSASPQELRLMLLEGAAKFARQGRDGLVASNYEQSYEGFSQARDIIVELISTMNEKVDPELCERVRSLYTFIYTELVKASFEKAPSHAETAIELIDYEVETWKLLMSKLEEEQAGSGLPAADAPVPEQEPASKPRLSVSG